MIRRPPRSTLSSSSAASDVYKRQEILREMGEPLPELFVLPADDQRHHQETDEDAERRLHIDRWPCGFVDFGFAGAEEIGDRLNAILDRTVHRKVRMLMHHRDLQA